MCLSCGCGLPQEDHGSPDHITYQMVAKAADAAHISPKQAIRNIVTTAKLARRAQKAARHELTEGPGSAPEPDHA